MCSRHNKLRYIEVDFNSISADKWCNRDSDLTGKALVKKKFGGT